MWPLYFGLLIALMLIGIASFEALVYVLFTRHRSDWQRAGEPIGIGQPGIGTGLYGWMIARHKLQKQLLFYIPSWAKDDPLAYGLLILYKASVIIYLSGVLGFLVAALLLS